MVLYVMHSFKLHLEMVSNTLRRSKCQSSKNKVKYRMIGSKTYGFARKMKGTLKKLKSLKQRNVSQIWISSRSITTSQDIWSIARAASFHLRKNSIWEGFITEVGWRVEFFLSTRTNWIWFFLQDDSNGETRINPIGNPFRC